MHETVEKAQESTGSHIRAPRVCSPAAIPQWRDYPTNPDSISWSRFGEGVFRSVSMAAEQQGT
jgi:hypothetical protein